jgi:hypothetical protein
MAVEAKEEDPNGHVAHVRFNIKAFFFHGRPQIKVVVGT